MPETLSEQLIRHEGIRLFPYEDSAGKLTIGVGRNLEDCGISRGEAVTMLWNDIYVATNDLRAFDWFHRLDGTPRGNALVNLRFNVGAAGFREFKKMIEALERGDYEAAAREMLDSSWHRQVGARAEELARMVETGLPPEIHTRSV